MRRNTYTVGKKIFYKHFFFGDFQKTSKANLVKPLRNTEKIFQTQLTSI